MKRVLVIFCVLMLLSAWCWIATAEDAPLCGLWGLLDDDVVYYATIHDETVFFDTFLITNGTLLQSVEFKVGGAMEVDEDGYLVFEPLTLEPLTSISPVEDADEIAGSWAYVHGGISAVMAFDGSGNYFTHSYSSIPGVNLKGVEGTYTLEEDVIAFTSADGTRSYNTYSIVGELLVMIPSGSTEAMTWTRLDK